MTFLIMCSKTDRQFIFRGQSAYTQNVSRHSFCNFQQRLTTPQRRLYFKNNTLQLETKQPQIIFNYNLTLVKQTNKQKTKPSGLRQAHSSALYKKGKRRRGGLRQVFLDMTMYDPEITDPGKLQIPSRQIKSRLISRFFN